MLDLFTFCPNAPPCMMMAPPTERHATGYSEQRMREMLPKPEVVDMFIGDVTMMAGDPYKPPVSVSRFANTLFISSSDLRTGKI